MAHTIQVDARKGSQVHGGPTPTHGGAGATGKGTVTREDAFRVPPDAVRQLEAGEAFVIAGGKAARVRVLRLELPEGLDAGAIPPPDPPALSSAPVAPHPKVPGV
jgi:hypothetical protein